MPLACHVTTEVTVVFLIFTGSAPMNFTASASHNQAIQEDGDGGKVVVCRKKTEAIRREDGSTNPLEILPTGARKKTWSI